MPQLSPEIVVGGLVVLVLITVALLVWKREPKGGGASEDDDAMLDEVPEGVHVVPTSRPELEGLKLAKPVTQGANPEVQSEALVEALVRASEPEALGLYGEEGDSASGDNGDEVDAVGVVRMPAPSKPNMLVRPADLGVLSSTTVSVVDVLSQDAGSLSKVLGTCVLQDQLGVGRQAVVFRALETQTKTLVAVKIYPAALGQREETWAHFQTRLKALKSVQHRALAAVLGGGLTEDARPYLVMEYMGGYSFESRLADALGSGGLPLGEMVDVCFRLLEGLDALHSAGVVHGAVKPSNIMRSTAGVLKLMDGAVVRVGEPALTAFGDVYLSPRLSAAQGAVIEPNVQDDLYALGMTLYQLLTVHVPSDTPEGGARAPMHPPRVHREELPRPLDVLVWRCVQPDPERRLKTAREGLEVLGELLSSGAYPDTTYWEKGANMDIMFSHPDVLMDDDTELAQLLMTSSQRLRARGWAGTEEPLGVFESSEDEFSTSSKMELHDLFGELDPNAKPDRVDDVSAELDALFASGGLASLPRRKAEPEDSPETKAVQEIPRSPWSRSLGVPIGPQSRPLGPPPSRPVPLMVVDEMEPPAPDPSRPIPEMVLNPDALDETDDDDAFDDEVAELLKDYLGESKGEG